MATYGAMQTRIADEIARSDLGSQIQNAILDAIKAYDGERFAFNDLYRSTASVSVGEYAIALPSNVAQIDRITMDINASVEDVLVPRDAHFIIEAQTPIYSSQPKEYAIYADQILFNCAADQNYTIYINGLRRYDPPTVDGSNGPWFVEAEELIRNRAKANLYLDVIMDAENGGRCKLREQEAFRYLKGKMAIRGSGRVRPTRF
jgi:hypothetical protein